MAGTLQYKLANLPSGVIVRIGLGSDEIGFECKELLKARFSGQGHAAEDVSTGDLRRTDYQSIANELASAIYTGRVERGVLICSRAIGASVMANKHPGVRAALCHDLNSARLGVQDDDMNLLHDGSRRRDARSGVRVGGRLLSRPRTFRASGRLAFLRGVWRASSSTSETISTNRS